MQYTKSKAVKQKGLAKAKPFVINKISFTTNRSQSQALNLKQWLEELLLQIIVCG